MEFERPIATVDIALFTLIDDRLNVVLIRRDREPYPGQLALPGGYVHTDEDKDTHATARRVLKTKTGLSVRFLEQLAVFSGRKRDPRGWSISTAYVGVVAPSRLLSGAYETLPVVQLPTLAFDHAEIIHWAVDRIRNKSTYSSLPAFLLPKTFTMRELRLTYEKIIGITLDKASFRRKIEDQGIIEPVPGELSSPIERVGGKPAQLFRLTKTKLHKFDEVVMSS